MCLGDELMEAIARHETVNLLEKGGIIFFSSELYTSNDCRYLEYFPLNSDQYYIYCQSFYKIRICTF
jgi:hypothetical protein